MKLPRSRRMTAGADFRRVRESGRSTAGRSFVLAVLPSDGDPAPPTRFGFITPKRLGSAVVRNRLRRQMRAIVRELGGDVRAGLLVVTIGRHGALRRDFGRLRSEWADLARRMKILRHPTNALRAATDAPAPESP